MSTGEWRRVESGLRHEDCPPHYKVSPHCAARRPGWGFLCTRLDGHTGRHAAGTGEWIVAVWR